MNARKTKVESEIVVRLSLSAAWRREAIEGRLLAPFLTRDGSQGSWGVALEGGALEFFQQDQGALMRHRAAVEERTLARGRSVLYHPFRASRPGATKPTLGRQPDLLFDPEVCPFGCQDPRRPLSLLTRLPLAQFTGPCAAWNAYPNAAPFTPEGHFLWIPITRHGATTWLPHMRQRLSLESVTDFVTLAGAAANSLLFFNSLHAGATTNHLHFQGVFHAQTFAIEEAPRSTVGPYTILDYDARGLVFGVDASVASLWSCVDRLQRSDIPFNLIAAGESIYLIPRNSDHEVVAEFPGGVLASMEIAGLVITGDRTVFEGTTAGRLAAALSRSTLSIDEIVDLVGGG